MIGLLCSWEITQVELFCDVFCWQIKQALKLPDHENEVIHMNHSESMSEEELKIVDSI